MRSNEYAKRTCNCKQPSLIQMNIPLVVLVFYSHQPTVYCCLMVLSLYCLVYSWTVQCTAVQTVHTTILYTVLSRQPMLQSPR